MFFVLLTIIFSATLILIAVKDTWVITDLEKRYSSFDDLIGSPVQFNESGEIDHANFIEKLDELVEQVKFLSPDHIIGVHTGGRLLSVLISERVGVEDKNCHYVHSNHGTKLGITLHTQSNTISGNVVVVDDISRSGGTLDMIYRNLVRGTFAKEYFIEKIDFFVMLLCSQATSKRAFRGGFFLPDWYGFFTQRDDAALPWSRLTSEISSAISLRNQGKSGDVYFLKLYDQLISDANFARAIAEFAIADPINFGVSVKEKTLVRQRVKVD